jgi:trehalose 6-phosphate phosphatase
MAGKNEQMDTADLPPMHRAAFLLDVDGTLLDFAATPLAVVVPADLPATLRALKGRVGGALGIISGRPVEQVAALFGDIPQAIAGEHGGAVRHAPDGAVERPALAAAPPEWLAEAERMAVAHPGTLLEHKARGFVLHYRNAPAAGQPLHDALAVMLAHSPYFALLPAHMAWEVRPRGTDKGMAVTAIMERPPFAGRVPVFVGDDVTDEDAVRAAQAIGGIGLMVADAFGDPAGVRAWLRRLAELGW